MKLKGKIFSGYLVLYVFFMSMTIYLNKGKTIGQLLVLGILSLIVSIGLGFYFANSIVNPLQKLIAYCQGAASGDFLQKDLKLETHDEIQELAIGLNQLNNGIRQIITQVADGVDQLINTGEALAANATSTNHSAQQVTLAIQEVAKGMAEQTRFIAQTRDSVKQQDAVIQELQQGTSAQINDVNETSYLVGEMASSIQDVSASATTVSETADKTRAVANNGAQAVKLTVTGMVGIKAKVFETASKITELGEYSTKIGEIIQVIDEIAEQTNLLALNAAIEAARAGEHGKGFAVVADEVRKLAERSGKATKEIANLINNMQQLTAVAVSTMEAGTSEVEKGAQLAQDAGAALNEILEMVEETCRQIQNITTVHEQLGEGSVQMVIGMENVAVVTVKNTEDAIKISEASNQIANAMENIVVITEESSASSEEVSAVSEQMAASLGVIEEAATKLGQVSNNLHHVLAKLKIN